jgi:dephospho-CoA kinase
VSLPDFPVHVPVIGLVGGVASGKSLVASQLADLGAGRLDADGAGHEVLRETEVEQAARRRWGERVFDVQGRIDRSALAKIVFAPPPDGPAELHFLEQLTHPRIGARLRDQAHRLVRSGHKALVLDAAVMDKAGWDAMCDKILFIDAPRTVRLERALARGWTERQFDAREAAQASLEARRARSDQVIDNSGTPSHTQIQVERFWNEQVK